MDEEPRVPWLSLVVVGAAVLLGIVNDLILELIRGTSGPAIIFGGVMMLTLHVMTFMFSAAALVLVACGSRGLGLVVPALTSIGRGWIPFVLVVAWGLGMRPRLDLWTVWFLLAMCLPGVAALVAVTLLRRRVRWTRS